MLVEKKDSLIHAEVVNNSITKRDRLCIQEWHDVPCHWDLCQACQEECPEPLSSLVYFSERFQVK